MATTSVIQFMLTTAENETIRAQLEALLGVGDGDISNGVVLSFSRTVADD